MSELQELFEGLTTKEIAQLVTRLGDFAAHLLRRKRWRGQSGALAESASEPEDLVQEAITRVVIGKRSTWSDSRHRGDGLESYLKWVIASIVWAEATRLENRLEQRASNDEAGQQSVASIEPDEQLEADERESSFLADLAALGLDPELLRVANAIAFHDCLSPREVAAFLDMDIDSVRNTYKRLRRRLRSQPITS